MKFKVKVTEHERGWGQRDEYVVKDTYEEAYQYYKWVNDQNTESRAPDIYWVASLPKPME